MPNPEVHTERGKRLEFTWYDNGKEIVIMSIRAIGERETGAVSAMADRHDPTRPCRALMVTNPIVAGILERRGWKKSGNDYVFIPQD